MQATRILFRDMPSRSIAVRHTKISTYLTAYKVTPPFREAEFGIIYGERISKWTDQVDLAVKFDIIQKSGS